MPYADELALFCKSKKKPIMIAESTPFGGINQGLNSGGNQAGAWWCVSVSEGRKEGGREEGGRQGGAAGGMDGGRECAREGHSVCEWIRKGVSDGERETGRDREKEIGQSWVQHN